VPYQLKLRVVYGRSYSFDFENPKNKGKFTKKALTGKA